MSREQLLELVQWLLAEQVRLRAEIEQLNRNNARAAAPFSKNQRKKNPPRPGRKAGQGTFRHRPAPPAEEYTGAVEDVPVTSTHCPDCGGVLVGDEEEIVTQTELPPTPKPDIKAYRIQIRSCCRCQRKVRGAHPEVSPDQYGATAHRLGPRAQAALRLGTGDGPVAQQYEQLRGQIKEQPAINTDDTGSRRRT